MNFKLGIMALALCLPGAFLGAQGLSKAPENWFTLDKAKDGVQGTGANEALAKLKAKGKKGQTIIVAVLDSGVDVMHEDLKDIMWTNPNEIPDNGKDDDGNGYADDIHGWNFLGGKDGKNVEKDSWELAREYGRLSKKFQGTDGSMLTKEAKKDYEYFQKVKVAFDEARQESLDKKARTETAFDNYEKSFRAVGRALGKTTFVKEDLAKVKTGDNAELKDAVAVCEKGFGRGLSPENLMAERKKAIAKVSEALEVSFNPDYNSRTIVGDNYDDLNDRYYGNNNYRDINDSHGTHVAGIIAAIRNNNIGMDGVADNVRIMSVRCVPDGDERDKDVANAIRYAVENGASIINMSFGKGYSPNKKYVDEAIQFAADHDVLLVHAAGNESENNDETMHFPNDTYEQARKKGLFKKEKTAPNWLEIGASSWRTGEKSVARFSNYGKKGVDLFAPGQELYATVLDNKYASLSGTSMAAPAAAGVAAIIRSYYPELSAKQVKGILEKSVTKIDELVLKPGSNTEKIKFSDLCASGGVINAPNAVDLADQTKAKKVKSAIWRDAGTGKLKKTKTVVP